MPVRPLVEAQDVIGPYTEALVDLVQKAHSDFVRSCGALLHQWDDRTKASAIRDMIVFRAKGWADSTAGVHFFREGQLCWLGFRNNWVARVKMMDDRFGVSVSPTKASEQYDRNETPESVEATLVEGLPPTMLYLGWRTTENAPMSPDVSLICNNDKHEAAWIWPLKGREPPPAFELTPPSPPDDGNEGERRIKIPARKITREA